MIFIFILGLFILKIFIEAFIHTLPRKKLPHYKGDPKKYNYFVNATKRPQYKKKGTSKK